MGRERLAANSSEKEPQRGPYCNLEPRDPASSSAAVVMMAASERGVGRVQDGKLATVENS